MTKSITCRGRHTPDPDRLYGPDTRGIRYRPTSAVYNPDTDQTTITLRPLTDTELAALIETHRNTTWQHIETRQNLAALFEGHR